MTGVEISCLDLRPPLSRLYPANATAIPKKSAVKGITRFFFITTAPLQFTSFRPESYLESISVRPLPPAELEPQLLGIDKKFDDAAKLADEALATAKGKQLDAAAKALDEAIAGLKKKDTKILPKLSEAAGFLAAATK